MDNMPFCDGDGTYYTGPVCNTDGICQCIDAMSGKVSVSAEGIELSAGITLPSGFFGGWTQNGFDCSLFSSDPSDSFSLLDESLHMPDEVMAQIPGLN